MSTCPQPCPPPAQAVCPPLGPLRKPALRNLHYNWLKKHLWIATGLSVVASVWYYFGYMLPKRHKFAEFHKHYDPEAEAERMDSLGLFESSYKSI